MYYILIIFINYNDFAFLFALPPPPNVTKLSDTPWKSIFTSLPLWATTTAHAGHNWGFWLLLTEMPTFIHTVFKVDLKEDGMLSALPYLAMFLLQIPVLYVADTLNRRQVTTLTVSRKAWNTVSMWSGAAGLAGLGYLNDTTTTITLYVLIVAVGCTTNAGFNINHMDLSPNYAGLLMGITNTAASSGGIIAPLLVGFLVDDPVKPLKRESNRHGPLSFLSAARAARTRFTFGGHSG